MWRSAGFQRVLFTSDILASGISLAIIVVGAAKLKAHLPEDHTVEDVYLGPGTAFSTPGILLVYTLAALAPLVWLLYKPQSYFKHRTAITIAIRLLRLLLQAAMLLTPSAAAPLARIAVARALDQSASSPLRAMGIICLMPLGWYLHHGMLYLLPWKYALAFQLSSTAILLHWSWQLPCFLQEAGRHASTQMLHAQAGLACSTLQSHASLLRTALGAPLSEFSRTLCQNTSALQAVHIFCTLVSLLVVPLVLSHELERWMRLRSVQHPAANQGTAAAGATRDGSGSSSSSRQQAVSNIPACGVHCMWGLVFVHMGWLSWIASHCQHGGLALANTQFVVDCPAGN